MGCAVRLFLKICALLTFGCDLNLQEQTTTIIENDVVQVTHDGRSKANPAWSSDGELLAFSSRVVVTRFIKYSVDGEEQNVLAGIEGPGEIGSSSKVALSSDGNRLAYRDARIGHLWVTDFRDGSKVLLTPEQERAFDPAWSRDGNWIAYRALDPSSTSFNLWMIPATGGTPMQLTFSQDIDSSPAWSPDGTQIVFDRRFSTQAVWMLTITDGNVRQLMPDSTNSRSPSWSPDGSTIAFVATINDTTGIWTMPAQGGSPKKLTNSLRFADKPAWSPDGSRIAFRSSRIMIMSKNGEDLVETRVPASFPIWLPDGESFLVQAFVPSEHIDVLSMQDSLLMSLTERKELQRDLQATWFPGEHRIAFVRQPPSFGNVQIWTVSYPDGEETLVTEVPPEVRAPLNPDFSPDGTKIALEYRGEILIIQLTTREIKFLRNPSGGLADPTWSPDGTRLACLTGSSFRIFRMDSNPFRPIAEVHGRFTSISWSPHNPEFGSHIAVESQGHIFVASPEELQLELGVRWGRFPEWSPDGRRLAYISGGELHIMRVFVNASEK
ncbi:hypothetical protein MJD09_09785 [bacterium]|nr:hypothetical protein [bacterium]